MRYGNHVFVEQENRRLTTRLQKAEALLAYQKKVAESPADSSETGNDFHIPL